MRLLTAIAGFPGAGKSELGNTLRTEYGFTHVVGSDIIAAAHATWDPSTRGPLDDRDDYSRFYKLMTKEKGYGSIAATIFDIMDKTEGDVRLCYDGIRNRHDARRVRKGGGIIVALDCPPEIRRIRFNGRTGKNLAPDAFLREDMKEYNSPDEDGLHLCDVMEWADVCISGEPPVEEVARNFIAALRRIGIEI